MNNTEKHNGGEGGRVLGFATAIWLSPITERFLPFFLFSCFVTKEAGKYKIFESIRQTKNALHFTLFSAFFECRISETFNTVFPNAALAKCSKIQNAELDSTISQISKTLHFSGNSVLKNAEFWKPVTVVPNRLLNNTQTKNIGTSEYLNI